jgi:acyl-[acyl carrier protein]--UDP-N-acetylglucosamine O-acyltransferase
MDIHPTSIIEDGAKIGENVFIGLTAVSVRMQCWATVSV